MDNASKALIMAGAILISVAIVGIGIYIFSAANSMTNDAVNTMESTQVQMFNNQFYRYANNEDVILGTRAKELNRHALTVTNPPITITNGDSLEDRAKYQVVYDIDPGSGYITTITFNKQ